MIYCFDIDGTICTKAKHYVDAKPIQLMIDRINFLYNHGNFIKIFTARGQSTGVDHRELTVSQLIKWGVRYHELIVSKPSADFYIDDKALTPEMFHGVLLPCVFTNGCFDILHSGHIKLLREANQHGRLIVGLNTDESINRIKGEGRPINPLKNRMELLSSIKYVDNVIPFNDNTPIDLIKKLKPSVLVKGVDWKGKLPEAKIVESYGGKVVYVELLPDMSTTGILGRYDPDKVSPFK